MAYIVADRIKETTTTQGTGAISLAGAVSGYRAFASQMSIGDTCAYAIVSATGLEWEVGIATYSAVNTLTRTTVQSSTNANALVNFSAGLKDVFLGPTAGSVPGFNPITNTITSGTWNGNTIDVAHGGTGLTALGTANQVLAVNPAGTALEYHTITSNPGTVTSVGGTGTVNGLTLTGTVTSSGNLTLGGTLAIAPSQVTGTAVITSDSRLSDSRTPTGSAGGVLAGTYPNPSFASTTGSGAVVLSTTPTLVTPQTNAINAVPVVSGAGNSLTLAAGSAVGTGAGGSLVLQAGIQATSGGDGKVVVKQVAGQTSNLQEWQDSSGNIRGYISATDSSTIARFSLERSGGSEGFYVTTTNGGTRGLWLTGSMIAAFGCTAVNNTDAGSIVTGSAIATRGDVGEIGFGAGTNPASRDVVLRRDAADTLAQRRSTNPQSFRVYNTYTDASNYERLGITWTANVCYIKNANLGTGSARLMVPVTGATTVALLPSASTAGTGARSFVTDATATTFLSVVTGGGSNKVPVVSDGTNWLIG